MAKGGAIAPVRYSELLASKKNVFLGWGWAPIFILGAMFTFYTGFIRILYKMIETPMKSRKTYKKTVVHIAGQDQDNTTFLGGP